MMVLVDTSVWSLALRRRAPVHAAVGELRALTRAAPADVGRDPAYAERSATGRYRTTPLRRVWQHPPYSTTAARQI